MFADLLQVALSPGERNELRNTMLSDWQSQHELLVHDEQVGDETVSVQAPTLCCRLGICVCQGLGLKALRFHRKLTASLEPSFTPRRQKKNAAELSAELKAEQATKQTFRRLLKPCCI